MASPDDELSYLSPSFDPTSLTMPRLRNILMSHDIPYPASAKKPQLVEIFNQELKPKARKILAARDRVRRTSRGITDMPGSQEGTTNGTVDGDTGLMLPPPVPDTPRQRKPRKVLRPSVEPTVSDTSAITTASGARRSSNKHARHSDTEPEAEPPRPSVRKSRKSGASSMANDDSTQTRPPIKGGVFSDENPFQSGSSPLTPGEIRRKSAGTSSDKRKSSSSRRRTEGVTSLSKQQDGIIVPTSKTFVVPVSRPKHSVSEDEHKDGTEAGEEFTAEEQLDLTRRRVANGEVDILPPRKHQRARQSRTIPKSAPWVVLMALLGGCATWWRQEKLAIGYCGIGTSSEGLSNVHVPGWAEVVLPTCEPCPQHAICFQGMETRCEHDFILQPHPLSFGGLVPVPPSCEPDGEKVRRVKAVADKAVEELRERRALAECGRGLSAEIEEEELKKEVGKKRRRNMNAAEFEDLWKGAMGEIVGREEVVSSSDGIHLHLSSTSLASLSLSCAFKRSARLTLARHRLSLSIITLSGVALLYGRSLILTSRSDTARVPSLVATALDRLATQAALHARGDAAESWISVGQLRDDVLRDEFSDRRRESMWTRVRAVVERNANVRASVREGRGGDVSRVWEWVGSVNLLEDATWSGGGKNRVSIVPDVGASAIKVEDGRKIVERRKWDEGRPVY